MIWTTIDLWETLFSTVKQMRKLSQYFNFLIIKFVREQKKRLTFFSDRYFPVSLFRLRMCIFAFGAFLGVLLVFVPCLCSGCPPGCECFAVTHTVKCVSRSLLSAPQNIPGHARTVVITGNNIHQIGADSFIEPENVTNIILSNNRWECQYFSVMHM